MIGFKRGMQRTAYPVPREVLAHLRLLDVDGKPCGPYAEARFLDFGNVAVLVESCSLEVPRRCVVGSVKVSVHAWFAGVHRVSSGPHDFTDQGSFHMERAVFTRAPRGISIDVSSRPDCPVCGHPDVASDPRGCWCGR